MKKYGNSFRKKIAVFLALLTFTVSSVSVPSYAMEDGAYVVGRSTSYANPETGQIADGGSDQALGDSMCSSVVEGQALVEQSGGKTYVTLGMGLASNVSNVRMQVQTSSGGGFQSVGLTQTGSCSRDGDTCIHYRFEVVDPSYLISPVMYVAPMGRDVQFFVRLNMGSAQAGTGNFVSQMVQETEPETDTEEAVQEEEQADKEEKKKKKKAKEEKEVILVDIQGDPMEGVEGLRIHWAEEDSKDKGDS